ncbi:hypothetical protein [Marinicrinis sediminis]|uniref:MerR family transcriptional regulator n=1 Tax=Marinicrinis sediminis TaxID=1652465 RepID=A0ABW5REI8_9BACL
MEEVSQATRVPIETIRKYVMEGRILTHEYPNLAYACYFCEELITKGYLCKVCATKFLMEFQEVLMKEGYTSIDDYVKRSQSGKRIPALDRYVVESKNTRKKAQG